MGQDWAVPLALGLTLGIPLVVLWRAVRASRAFGTTAERATHAALHEASLAAPPLRSGLTEESARRSAGHLRKLLDSAAVALTDTERLLTWDGAGGVHARAALALADEALATGRTTVADNLVCSDPDCPVRAAVVAPLLKGDLVVGTLTAYAPGAAPGLVRAVGEVARWVSGQLELAELDESRSRLAEAQMRALRAQISPHFVYNALTAIASFVRTDPERARELLLEFADFTRYSSRTHGEYTTLAEELRSVDRYLLLERARFGDRLKVRLRIAPEVLPVAVPYLSLQPLVENAVKHGLDNGRAVCTVTIVAQDVGAQCLITVEDDGAGSDPERVRAMLSGDRRPPAPNPAANGHVASAGAHGGQHLGPDSGHDSMGLSNVDSRMRAIYGDDHGLLVETAVGAGTKVSLRVPKWQAGVRA